VGLLGTARQSLCLIRPLLALIGPGGVRDHHGGRDHTISAGAESGGDAQMSEARRQLIRRFAALAVLAENMEARLAMGETIDLAEHCTISSTLVRLTTRLGLNRHARMIPSLADYLASPEFRNSLPENDPGNELDPGSEPAGAPEEPARASDGPVAP
jgi:hypothetical protein